MTGADADTSLGFLAGGGDLGARMRSLDWSRTPLGPVAGWSRALRTCVDTCLGSAFPIAIWWGPQLAMLFNDEYSMILGPRKNALALGRPGAEVWGEIWAVVGPMLKQVIATGEAARARDLQLHVLRGDHLEESYFSFSYGPIRDDDGSIGGVFCPVIETTERVVAERRQRTLRDLASACRGAGSEAAVLTKAAEVLAANPHDAPFALLYRLDDGDGSAHLEASAGIAAGAAGAPLRVAPDADADVVDGTWPLAGALAGRTPLRVDDVAARFGALPTGAWSVPPRAAMVCPIVVPGQDRPLAVLVAAVSPMRPLDDNHASFFEMIAWHVAAGLADARALAEERRRAAALIEIDRAKTQFFSNVSHEFRTPLTLMLGPLEELLADTRAPLPPHARESVTVAHRNSLRLLRLVNTLLDFARIEAGRANAFYQPTDLGASTAELASSFRSACERAGLELVVDTRDLGEPAWVDRAMWEKIVLNLLSNAFKFTRHGRIVVRVGARDGRAELEVEDTGIGISAAELPRMFERFHRVVHDAGRTHEGTGIGLALVRELARLHGGDVRVASEPGVGSRFTVTIPLGSAHLDPSALGDASASGTSEHARAHVEEAQLWLVNDAPAPRDHADDPATGASAPAADRPRVVWADDNADMRAYVTRLLSPRFAVEAVADGAAALAACRREPPDLVLADIMMPGLDGLALLRELRAEPTTAEVPVVLLSARAGEESRVDGVDAGADDYLVKPFSASELVARVDTHARLFRMRRDAERALRDSEARFRHMADNSPVMIWVTEADGRCSFLNRSWYDFTGQTPATGLGFGWLDVVHPDDAAAAAATFRAANAKHAPFRLEYRLRAKDGSWHWMIDSAAPRFAATGEPLGYIGSVLDISDRKQAELEVAVRTRHLAESEERYRSLVEVVTDVPWHADADGQFTAPQPAWSAFTGQTFADMKGAGWLEAIHPDDRAHVAACWQAARASRGSLQTQGRLWHAATGAWRHVESRATPLLDDTGAIREWVGAFRDVHQRRVMEREREEALAREQAARAEAERAVRLKDEFLATLSHELRTPLNAILGWARLLQIDLNDPVKARHAAAVIERNGRAQAQLIADMLDMSRIVSGKMRLEVGDVELAPVVEAAIDALRPAAEAKGVHIECRREVVGIVRGDAARLQQIVWNLLSNAIKFSSRGGRVEVALSPTPAGARIVVRDEGEGIAPEFLPQLFARFMQDDASAARQHGGLGIGLALAKELAELHGGSVVASSAGKGHGSTFVVELPAARHEAVLPGPSRTAPGPASASAHAALRDLRVLLVDDEPDALALAQHVLERAGARVVACGGAAAALAALRGERFDVVVSDLAMPGMDGFEMIAAARREGVTTPALALTAFARAEDRARALAAGYQAHLPKPLETDDLIATVATLAGRGAVARG